MLTKLTKPQEKLLDETIKEWIGLITKGEIRFSRENIRTDINWLYNEAKLKPPKILVTDSLEAHKKQVQDSQKKHKFEFVQQEFGLGYESWLCLYEFLEKIKYTHNDKFMRYVNMMKKGIFSAVFTDTHAFLCTLPKNIHFNDNEQLHSVMKPAIEMLKGKNYYFIKGVRFDKILWEKITKRTLTVTEVLKLKNMEQRYIALDMFGPDEVVKQTKATLIDVYKSTSENLKKDTEIELWEIPKGQLIENRSVKMLKYKDPSTGRPYFSYVTADIMTAKDGMAWKFQITPEQYSSLKQQA